MILCVYLLKERKKHQFPNISRKDNISQNSDKPLVASLGYTDISKRNSLREG